ncbi:hypothetical protein DUI87_28903 [Hirundo rustica rustica]|uniref:Integrase catalytic domain-containing protein n=1 Tax=Hirundo rustica rustica TaxID=333673 RepID=A0A3M0J1F8_HIRRU|nr:hypothetical protein DUI87_28903 [Hirundo rustica rustica]
MLSLHSDINGEFYPRVVTTGQPYADGVNPRGLRAFEIRQTDVTEIAEFGRLKYVHFTVDTFPSAMWASAHTGEKTRYVIAHWRQAFAVLGIPSAVKTDNGPAYTLQKLVSVPGVAQTQGQHLHLALLTFRGFAVSHVSSMPSFLLDFRPFLPTHLLVGPAGASAVSLWCYMFKATLVREEELTETSEIRAPEQPGITKRPGRIINAFSAHPSV